ncbi:putative sugar kinase YdjH [Salinivirga cyanobacteriivorans]|uniref:Putative sugar kinase YdjH n=1 Tax=Salinivirga cyanobacteriivorans TaxID=1307839 RepID=A0A0S2HZ32_9BACT|nr:adenosine kinase [Salinivirga cyanobacteriivorans]ALO15237.1 putative sugar kinase YdjH [Salinivirga cyanobacteriivorans]
MKRILGMGNALVDMLVQIPNDDLLNEINFPKGSMQLVDVAQSDAVMLKTQNMPVQQLSGGSAGNTVHGIAALGGQTGFIGKVGPDELGKFFHNDLKNAGISATFIESKNPTGKAIAMITPDSERTFATHLGAAVELSAEDLKPDMFAGYEIFHIEGYLVQNHDLLRQAMQLAKNAGAKISIDMASFNVVEENFDFLWEMVKKYVDIVFANEDEAKAFTGKEPLDALKKIAEEVDYAIVKIGEKGALIQSGEEIVEIEAVGTNVIDTTGAGDLFASGFLFGLLNDWSIEKSGKAGAIMAGKIISKIGGRLSLEEIVDVKNHINTLI